jgi:ABC-type Mn2+/Zn2+ transport system ATPase subunit
MDEKVKEKLIKIMEAIYENSMTVTCTVADQEYVMNDVERLALLGLRLLKEEE